jgi:ABC-type glycerol-3-phosphate transport system substrate-binding protein
MNSKLFKRAAFFILVPLFLLIGCSPLKKLTVLTHLEPDQEFYFKNTILKNYEKKTSVKVNVLKYGNADSLESVLKKYSGKVNLVLIADEKSSYLMKMGYFKPLDLFLAPEDLRSFNENFLLSSFGMVDARPTLIPRQFETSLLVYSKSKVKDALKEWPRLKEKINGEIKRNNGFGLPVGYSLEADPNKWDYFDIAVVGLIWANSDYNGKISSRVAHIALKNNGLSMYVENSIYQFKGDSADVLSCRGDAVVDAVQWESFYAASGVYNKKMWESGWGGPELLEMFASGEIFLATLTQAECFYLHGTGHAERKGLLKDPSDLGVALMPTACSFELNEKGQIVRKGVKSVATKIWWWAIPFNASSVTLSYRLARFLSDTASQVGECTRFGMIPVRKEVVNDMSVLFKDAWTKEVLETALGQIVLNGNMTLINNACSDKIRKLYVELWYDIVVGHNWAESGESVPDRIHIKKVIESKYAPLALKIQSGS